MKRLGMAARTLGQMQGHRWLQAAAILSLWTALVIMGTYLNLCLNLNRLADGISGGQAVTAALKDGAGPAKALALAQKLRARPEVERVTYLSQAAALVRFKRQLGGQQGLLEGIKENPLPASLEIILRPDAPLLGVKDELSASGLVDEVVSSRPWLRRLESARSAISDLAAALGLLLFCGIVLLVANTVRLAVYVRRDQLEVMSLVGASLGFIRRPFLLEAVLQGLCASILATVTVWALFAVLSRPLALPLGLDLSGLFDFNWPLVGASLAVIATLASLAGGYLGVGRAVKAGGV